MLSYKIIFIDLVRLIGKNRMWSQKIKKEVEII